MQANPLDRYLRGGIDEVEGWLNPGAATAVVALDAFQKSRVVHGNVAEIGVHHGKLFTLLSLLRREAEAGIAIDVFEDQHANVDRSGSGDYDVFMANLARFEAIDNVSVWKRDSLTITSKDFCSDVRLFSVDGSHTAQHTLNDLVIAANAICAGGVVIVDDFYNPDWPGVQEGVHEFLRAGARIAPFAYGNNKLFMTDLPSHETYLDYVVGRWRPIASRSKLVRLHDHDALAFVLEGPGFAFSRRNELYLFSALIAGATRSDVRFSGFGDPQKGGRWTTAEHARIAIVLGSEVKEAPVELSLWLRPNLGPGTPARRVTLRANGQIAWKGTFSTPELQRIRFPLPQGSLSEERLRLDLHIQVPGSDAHDPKALGFLVNRIALAASASP